MSKTLICGIALAILLPMVTVAAPIVANGSFEADTFAFGGTLGFGCANTLTAWVGHCSPDQEYPWGLGNVNSFAAGPTPFGTQWVVLGDFGRDDSWIEQAVSGFTVGNSYTLSFAIASEFPGGGGSTICVSLTAGSCSSGTDFSAPLRGAHFWDTWATHTLTFTATATTMTLHFEGVPNAVAEDVGLDNVHFGEATTVPEPASLTLMGLGLAGLVLVRRRRK